MSIGNTRCNYSPRTGARMCVAAAILLLFACHSTTYGFNFDQRAPLVFTGPAESLFGFSVAQHRDGNTDWALIGAPEASTNQLNVEQGGAVYKCPIMPLESRGQCEQVIFDSNGQQTGTNKSHQWFGATVESSGPDGKILACAPRLVWYRDPSQPEREREPTGTCFVGTSDFSVIDEFSPCQTTDRALQGFDGITHCLAGVSAKIPKDNDVVVIGTPGSYFLQGQIYAQNLVDKTDVISTREDSAEFDNSYRGFSLALGDFNGDGEEDFVVGIPRGSFLLGMVSVYDNLLTSLVNVTGKQLVSYFGNSVEAVDVNGDGLDDVLVGAPMHTDKTTAIEKWEAGQVYVYLQNPDHSLREPQLITGNAIRARFGYSMSAIGDADQDGFNDMAIGAPYDGVDENGMVYIFHGAASGLRSEPSQILSPSSLGQTGIKSFGFSVRGGQDMDGNNYPDLLVGAESSDKAVLVRTRPVVHLDAELTLDPLGINLDDRSHRLTDGTMVTGFVVSACFNFNGSHLPANIDIIYTLTLDSRVPSNPRAFFETNNKNTYSLQRNLEKGNKFCDVQQAYVSNAIQDKLTPIAVTVTYDLDQDETSLGQYDILPILDMNAVSSKTKQVYIQNNCQNNVCIPELGVRATANPSSITVGGMEDLTLDITLVNKGEDAFQSTLDVYYPQGLQYVRIERTSQMDLSVTCTDDSNARIISCDTGNPLSANYELVFGLTMATTQVTGDKENIEFYMIAKSENIENEGTLPNNELNMTVGVAVNINLKLLSASDPETVTYPMPEDGVIPPFPSTNASEADIGPAIMHLFEVRNGGPSTAGKTDLSIKWPQKDAEGEHLFYLLGLSIPEGVSCAITGGAINPEGVRLEKATQDQLSNISSSVPSRLSRREIAPMVAPVAQAQTDPIYCTADQCVKIQCVIDELPPGESKVVRLLGRFWARTFSQKPATDHQVVSVASSASAEVQEVPYNIAYTPGRFNDATKASTTVSSEDLQPVAVSIAWWIIVVSVIGGILLLLLIILGLWKCGFFERKKPGEDSKGNGAPYVPVSGADSAPPKKDLGSEGDEV